jgi:hypothetical protein
MIEHWVCSLGVLQYLSVVEKSVTFGVCMRDKGRKDIPSRLEVKRTGGSVKETKENKKKR